MFLGYFPGVPPISTTQFRKEHCNYTFPWLEVMFTHAVLEQTRLDSTMILQALEKIYPLKIYKLMCKANEIP